MFLVVQLDFFSLFANFPISSTTLFMSKAVKGLLVAKSEFYLLVVAPRTRLNANREIGIVDVLANLMVELFAGHLGECDCKIRHFQLKAMDGVGCHLLQGKRLGVIALQLRLIGRRGYLLLT